MRSFKNRVKLQFNNLAWALKHNIVNILRLSTLSRYLFTTEYCSSHGSRFEIKLCFYDRQCYYNWFKLSSPASRWQEAVSGGDLAGRWSDLIGLLWNFHTRTTSSKCKKKTESTGSEYLQHTVITVDSVSRANGVSVTAGLTWPWHIPTSVVSLAFYSKRQKSPGCCLLLWHWCTNYLFWFDHTKYMNRIWW